MSKLFFAFQEKGIENLFGQFFNQSSSIQGSESGKGKIKCGLASELYLRILACGISFAVLNETNSNGMIDLDSRLSSQVLTTLMKTASDILDQDQRKLVRNDNVHFLRYTYKNYA